MFGIAAVAAAAVLVVSAEVVVNMTIRAFQGYCLTDTVKGGHFEEATTNIITSTTSRTISS